MIWIAVGFGLSVIAAVAGMNAWHARHIPPDWQEFERRSREHYGDGSMDEWLGDDR